ncbi:MAG: sigma 54-interacting transcriptional regulator [Acidobacteria bacterium]|nr:sigma 54-interacting transcriptional regulator [Acidobacteriota bacterium]
MQPRLIAVSGPLAGQTFPLGAARLTLGRDHGNAVHLRDLAVSRHHCVVEPDGERFHLRDLDSRCGTFVNGVPVRERNLEHRDRIKLGNTLLLFESRPEETANEAVLLDDGTDDAATTTVHRACGESWYLLREAILAALPEEARTARDLQALLRIGNDLHALHAVEPIARRLLELALETIPAERAAVLLLEGAPPVPAASFALERGGSTAPFTISRHLVERIVAEGMAVFQDALETDREWSGVESVAGARLHSLLAAPLTGPDGPLGILYLDTRDPGTRFDERHLDLLTAAAGIASAALSNARLLAWLHEENRRMEEALDSEIIGESACMKELSRVLARVAPTDSTVLLLGESGTGKEVAARSLHRNSRRSGRPFVAVNCATLSETLLESELFGHERGAFTGALERKTGKIEAAEGGTLFLDEVGELPIAIQAKLLRVLQEREYERVGGTRPLKTDVRLVAATNRDLEKAMREGTFREDLFYRLNVIPLTLPPLRERREDVSLLASHFAALFSRRLGRRIAGFTPEARACLQRYGWPGNVRELANAIERALVLGEGELIRPEDLPETVLEAGPVASAGPVDHYHESVNAFKRRLILDALAQAEGNVTRAAERLDLNPTYLHRLMRNLDLKDRT